MSAEEKLELVQRLYEATRRGNLEEFIALHHPDATVIPLILEVEGRGYRGHEGVRRFWEEIHAAFPDWHWEAEQVYPAAGDAVIVDVHIRGAGTGSGVTVDQRAWHAIRLLEGRVHWWQVCRTRSQALAAAGLSD